MTRPLRIAPANSTRPRHRPRLAALAALLLAAPAPAQTAPSPYDRAIAAGYKAAMLCSALFNARAIGGERSVDSVRAHELRGIYPDYDALIATMPETIGTDRVTVRYDDRMPPRVAVSRGVAGCTNLPIGADPATTLDVSVRADDRRPARWPAGDAASVRAPSRTLAPIFDRVFSDGYGARTDSVALLVVQDGRIVAERYADGFGPAVPTRTWSVAKSIAGTLLGAATHQRLIDPAAPAPVPEWQAPGDPRRAITTDQLLRMASGLHGATAGNRADAVYFGGTAVTEETVAWPLEVAPGTRFRYANNDILLAVRALRSVAGDDPNFADRLLFGPMGLRGTIAEQDWRHNYILSSQVWATTRDLARFGQLWLDDGVWAGRRLLPEGWMQAMTAPTGPQPESGPGYGRTLWLFGPAEGLPAGSFAAQGNRGQYVMVVPSGRLVIVRRGEDPSGAGFDIARLTADLLAALR